MLFSLVHLLDDESAMRWMNYPGLELWKFLNLIIFVGAAIFLVRRPLAQALASRREGIKAELLRARKERDEALALLAGAEAQLERLDTDVAALKEEARAEAELERQRLKAATDIELEKLGLQAQREVETAVKIARQELRRFLAERSVEIATEKVVREIRSEDEARLLGVSIGELGRKRI